MSVARHCDICTKIISGALDYLEKKTITVRVCTKSCEQISHVGWTRNSKSKFSVRQAVWYLQERQGKFLQSLQVLLS